MSFATPSEDGTWSGSTYSTPATAVNQPSAFAKDLANVNDKLLSGMIHSLDLDRVRDDLIEIAKNAGQMMLDADITSQSSDTKRNTSDRVTEIDIAVEKMVFSALTSKYPEIEFLGEETSKKGQELSDNPTFICDPIDGTLNFIHGFPNVAISLALTVRKQPIVGVVYNAFRGDLFHAIRGSGAFWTRSDGRNTKLPIRQNPEPLGSLNDCLVAVEWGSKRDGPRWSIRSGVAKQLLTSKAAGGSMCHSIRSSGSAALDMCYVAAGWFDAFWEDGCYAWDVAGGWIVVEEAGGKVVGARPGQWEASVDGSSYFAVRAAENGPRDIIVELWDVVESNTSQ